MALNSGSHIKTREDHSNDYGTMSHYLERFIEGYGYVFYLWQEITRPGWHNYFYWLTGISLVFFMLESLRPWREGQPRFRRDFWLDVFYMYFNFFLFSLVIYNAASNVVVDLFNDGMLALTGFDLQQSNPMRAWPLWAVLLTGFFVRDFVQWWVHRLLHRVAWLWEFHKVHHSAEQMGFAAHLRYHWMETVVYRSIEYVPLALLGIGLYDFFIIHLFTLTIGHYNHSNLSAPGWLTGGLLGLGLGGIVATGALDVNLITDPSLPEQGAILAGGSLLGALLLGPFMKRLFNSPEMHIWHHAYEWGRGRPYGVNFGISLALWDYLFGTAYMPYNGRDLRLGFPGIERFPRRFVPQALYGLRKSMGHGNS